MTEFVCEACHAARQHGLDWAPPEGVCLHSHPHVLLRAGQQHAYVDAGMAPLVSALWQRGVRTYFSCQGEPGHMRGYVLYHRNDHDAAAEVLALAGLAPEYEFLHQQQEVIAQWWPPAEVTG